MNTWQTKNKKHGFTIVELLIVVVVIGILAAIVTVAYTGITQRANASAAKSNANSVVKVAEAYLADTGNGSSYPTLAQLNAYNGVSKVPASITVNSAALSATQADGKTIQYVPRSGNTGACIRYWDASLATPAIVTIYVGTATGGVGTGTPTCT